MTAKQIVLRSALAFLLATLCFMLIAASYAEATPMGLDLGKIADQAQQPVQRFAPARAGWYGPMVQSAQKNDLPGFAEMVNEAALAQAMRQQLEAIAIPDPRIVIGLATLIVLLRKWRDLRTPAASPAAQPA